MCNRASSQNWKGGNHTLVGLLELRLVREVLGSHSDIF